MLKIKYSNKKFYNKWVYKVTLVLKGCGIFRNNNLNDIRAFCTEENVKISFYDHQSSAYNNREIILEIVNFLENNKDIPYAQRIEGNFIDFYTNDFKFYKECLKEFDTYVKHGFEPLPGHEDEILNSSYVYTTKLPHNKYKFKVYLLPHKLKNDKDQKKNFITWATEQTPRVRISEAVKKWFIKTDWNWDRRYVLVEDEGTLLMLKLRNAEVVGKVHEYRLVDK